MLISYQHNSGTELRKEHKFEVLEVDLLQVVEMQAISRIGTDDKVSVGVEDDATSETMPEKRDWSVLMSVCLVQAFSGLERCHVILPLVAVHCVLPVGVLRIADLDPALECIGANAAECWMPTFEHCIDTML